MTPRIDPALGQSADAPGEPPSTGSGSRSDSSTRERGEGTRRNGQGDRPSSYYGRPVLKPPVWEDDIAYYFFLGGLAAGSSLLAAGADLTGRVALRRGGRVGALAALGAGTYYLIHDLGRPERFHHMLRVAKVTSPMSVGTWVLAAYGVPMGAAAVAELLPGPVRRSWAGRLLTKAARPAGIAAAGLAPAVASYTAVLLSQTAVPAWHAAHEELPFIFTASAAASAGGLGMIVSPVSEAAPARRLAMAGAVIELAASRRLESRLGVVGEAYLSGKAHDHLTKASTLTAAGVLASMLLGRRSRAVAVASGLALLAGGFYERLGLLEAGRQSAKDPKYTVEPQRARADERDEREATPADS